MVSLCSFQSLVCKLLISFAGYTYNYLSADNFALPNAFVRDGLFAPDGPAYRAMIIDRSANPTLNATRQMGQFAESGLPIILHGGASNKIPYIFDLWTGAIRLCFEYRRGLNDTTIIPLQLAANQTVVIGLSDKPISSVAVPSIHVLRAPRTVMGYGVNDNGNLVVRVAAGNVNGPLRLSSGRDKTKLLELVSSSS